MSTTTKINLTQYMDNIAKIDGRFRFCTFQTYDGQRRHYICGHHEYCCNLGCCVSTAFSFYQLWYFWLLILLIILLCSGGGWWFRWRHGHFGTRSATPTQGRRRHGGRGHGSRASRVYPNNYYHGGGNPCNLPPGYDKDPPSYNEVIAHLSQFPRADERYAAGNTSVVPTAPDLSQLLAVPPPSYQMVLDQKMRESQLGHEPDEVDEGEDGGGGPFSKIQSLLGRSRVRRDSSQSLSPPMRPPPVGSFPSAPPASSSPSSAASSGLFTISSESLPPIDPFPRTTNSENVRYLHPSPLRDEPYSSTRGAIPSPTGSGGSHSDYSSSFFSSPSTASTSSSSAECPSTPQSPPRYTVLPPTFTQTPPEVELRNDDLLEIGVGEVTRPCTGRSTLSRPTTSISTRSLPLPDEVPRKPSIPGALEEWEGEDEEEDVTPANSSTNNYNNNYNNNNNNNDNSSNNNENNNT